MNWLVFPTVCIMDGENLTSRTPATKLPKRVRNVSVLKKFEGCRLKAYRCPAGVWTIGYGHTSEVREGQWITQDQAESLLKEDLVEFARYINKMVTVPLNQNQFDALVCFCYNIGPGNFKGSTLLRLLNDGYYVAASNEFPKWRKAGGRVLLGLVRRRAKVRELFLSKL